MASLLAAGTQSAYAINLGFLHDTPASYMQQADYNALVKAVRAAADSEPDGQSATWTNEGLRNSVRVDATITAVDTEKGAEKGAEKDGARTCRTMQVVINAKQQSMTLRPRFCREGTGSWVYQKRY